MKLTNKEFYRNLNYLYGELKEKKIELQKRKTQDAPISELVNLISFSYNILFIKGLRYSYNVRMSKSR